MEKKEQKTKKILDRVHNKCYSRDAKAKMNYHEAVSEFKLGDANAGKQEPGVK